MCVILDKTNPPPDNCYNVVIGWVDGIGNVLYNNYTSHGTINLDNLIYYCECCACLTIMIINN